MALNEKSRHLSLRGPSFSLRAAPWHDVPLHTIVSLEHPFITKDVSQAVKSLGGATKISKLVDRENLYPGAALFLQPSDSMSQPLTSSNMRTNSVVIHITVPRQIGRKRKQGPIPTHQHEQISTGPLLENHMEAASMPIVSIRDKVPTANTVLRILEDNPNRYTVQVVGIIDQTHRFRDLPDFMYSTTSSAFVQKMRRKILPMSIEKLKTFSLDQSMGPKARTDLIPPPIFTHLSLPFNYSYLQNPAIKHVVDATGNLATINSQIASKIFTQRVSFDEPLVPVAPEHDLPPFEALDVGMRHLIKRLEECLENRPIWTRRALQNQIRTQEWCNIGKHVYQYVGYMFRSGPWREAVIKYGIDPRKDPQYRFYQTMMFQFDAQGGPTKGKAKGTERGGSRKKSRVLSTPNTHKFDGLTVNTDGKVWQVCDITDSILQSLLATNNIRQECHVEGDGWYHNGTWAKARVIMKARIMHILNSNSMLKDSDFVQIAALPDSIDQNNRHQTIIKKGEGTAQEIEWASAVRSLAIVSTGACPKRGSVKKSDPGIQDGPAHNELERPITVPLETVDPRPSPLSYQLSNPRFEKGIEHGKEFIGALENGSGIDTDDDMVDSSLSEESDD